MTLMRLMSAPSFLAALRLVQASIASQFSVGTLEGFFSVGRLKLSADRCVFVLRTHSECSAAFPAAGHSSYFSSRPDVAVIYRRSSSAVGSSNGREPKSASEKYDQPAELRLNVDSNQLQLLMSQSKGFFNIFSPPLPFHLCWVLM